MTSWPGPPAAALAELLQALRFKLLTPTRNMLPRLFELAHQQELSCRWLGEGALRDPSRFDLAIQASPAAFAVIPTGAAQPVGLVAFYDQDLGQGHAKVGVLSESQPLAANLVVQATLLAIEYAFAVWNLRIVYLEVVAGTGLVSETEALRLFRIEGRLRDHVFYEGGYHDLFILAVERNTWDRLATPLLDAIQGVGP